MEVPGRSILERTRSERRMKDINMDRISKVRHSKAGSSTGDLQLITFRTYWLWLLLGIRPISHLNFLARSASHP